MLGKLLDYLRQVHARDPNCIQAFLPWLHDRAGAPEAEGYAEAFVVLAYMNGNYERHLS